MAAGETQFLDDIIFQEPNKTYGTEKLKKTQDRIFLVVIGVVYGIILGWAGRHFIDFVFSKRVIPLTENTATPIADKYRIIKAPGTIKKTYLYLNLI